MKEGSHKKTQSVRKVQNVMFVYSFLIHLMICGFQILEHNTCNGLSHEQNQDEGDYLHNGSVGVQVRNIFADLLVLVIMILFFFSAFISIPPLLGWKKDPDLRWFEELKGYQQVKNNFMEINSRLNISSSYFTILLLKQKMTCIA